MLLKTVGKLNHGDKVIVNNLHLTVSKNEAVDAFRRKITFLEPSILPPGPFILNEDVLVEMELNTH